jgi:hypothetical protein
LYSRAGATLLLPSQGITPRPQEGKYVCYAGWSCSLALRTSRPTGVVAVLRALARAQARPPAVCPTGINTYFSNGSRVLCHFSSARLDCSLRSRLASCQRWGCSTLIARVQDRVAQSREYPRPRLVFPAA